MKRLFSVIPLMGVLLLAVPQIASGWGHLYSTGKYGRFVQQTADGGYILTGAHEAATSDFRLFLVKTDSSGTSLWARTYMSTESQVGQGYCVQLTSDGGYIIVGFRGAPFNTKKLWLIKTDSLGDTSWTRTYGEEYNGRGYFVEVTDDGGYIITGSMPSSGSGDMFLLKTDSYGNTLWERIYGDAGSDVGHCVRQTADGGYIITGRTAPNVDAKNRLWLVKTDGNGNKLWDKSYWGISEANSASYSVQQTADGGYVIVGEKDELIALAEGDLWLLKTNANGDTMWTQTYGVNPGYAEWGESVRQTPDGGYIITGVRNSQLFRGHDLWLLKTDSLGDTLWTQTYRSGQSGGIATGHCVQLTTDDGYIVSGRRNNSAWLLKTDSLGDTTSTSVIIEQPSAIPATHWHITQSVGHQIVLQYSDSPHGFTADIFDVTGRKVDELHAPLPLGTISWGQGYESGVYFIRDESDSPTTHKVVLIQ